MPSILVTDSQTLLPAGLATALLADGTPQCETFELNRSWCPGVIKATLNQLPNPAWAATALDRAVVYLSADGMHTTAISTIRNIAQ